MHPNKSFCGTDKAVVQALINQVGFGMVFGATADGPRVAHTPLLAAGENTIRFHLARSNALVGQIENAAALVVVNGPEAYVSPRWYRGPDHVPTWNYIAVEIEGTVLRLDEAGLVDLLDALSARHEARLEGAPWTRAKMRTGLFEQMLSAIVGFELTASNLRSTFKLSQNKSEADRLAVADGLASSGKNDIAAMMRTLGAAK